MLSVLVPSGSVTIYVGRECFTVIHRGFIKLNVGISEKHLCCDQCFLISCLLKSAFIIMLMVIVVDEERQMSIKSDAVHL